MRSGGTRRRRVLRPLTLPSPRDAPLPLPQRGEGSVNAALTLAGPSMGLSMEGQMASAAAVVGTRAIESVRVIWDAPLSARFRGAVWAVLGLCLVLAFASYSPADPSWNTAAPGEPGNWLGGFGAVMADLWLQSLGLAAWLAALLMLLFGTRRALETDPARVRLAERRRGLAATVGVLALAGVLSTPAPPAAWPLGRGLGGF